MPLRGAVQPALQHRDHLPVADRPGGAGILPETRGQQSLDLPDQAGAEHPGHARLDPLVQFGRRPVPAHEADVPVGERARLAREILRQFAQGMPRGEAALQRARHAARIRRVQFSQSVRIEAPQLRDQRRQTLPRQPGRFGGELPQVSRDGGHCFRRQHPANLVFANPVSHR